MTTSFHATLAQIAAYRATMLVECLLGRPLGIDAQEILVHNMQLAHPESAMNVADALVRNYDPTVQVFRGYSYDRVMEELPPVVIERSARRALASVPFGAVLDDQRADVLRSAIAVELSYLWLKATERFYDDLAADMPAAHADQSPPNEATPVVAIVKRINPMACEAVIDLTTITNGNFLVDVGDKLFATPLPSRSAATLLP